MHGPNHGCPKCVINDGFVGPIARLLAFTVGAKSLLHGPAIALAEAAEAATKVFDHARAIGLRKMPDDHPFAGCDEATRLMRLIMGGPGTTSHAALADASEIEKMRTEILGHIADLVGNTDEKD